MNYSVICSFSGGLCGPLSFKLTQWPQLGSLGLRVIAALFDAFVGALIWYPFFHFWGHYNEAEHQYQVTGLPALAMMFATAAYWILAEWLFGATVGKLICDLRVVSLTGKKCSFRQSVKRNLVRILDFLPFYLTGFLAAKFSPLRQRLGDQWAKTIVVKKDQKLQSNSTSEAEQHPI